jgi:hypothetical protein
MFALARIKTVFFAFGGQACEAGRQNLWSGETIRIRLEAYLNTVTTILSTVTGTVYHYSGTTSDAAGWASIGFNDPAWSVPVVQTHYTPTGVPSGATLITDSDLARTGQPATDLYRIPFSLPSGTSSARKSREELMISCGKFGSTGSRCH